MFAVIGLIGAGAGAGAGAVARVFANRGKGRQPEGAALADELQQTKKNLQRTEKNLDLVKRRADELQSRTHEMKVCSIPDTG